MPFMNSIRCDREICGYRFVLVSLAIFDTLEKGPTRHNFDVEERLPSTEISPTTVTMRFSYLAFLALLPALSLAQTDTSQQLDPSATCPYQTGDQIQACLAQVESDEAARSGGPCSSSDWGCICNKQQGLIDCYKPCPGTQDKEAVDYNNNNCAGQNGVKNAAAGGDATYTGSPLTTSVPEAGGQSTGSSPAATSSASTSSAPTSSSTSAATSKSSTSSAPSGSASTGSGNGAVALGAQGDKSVLVAGLAVLGGIAYVVL
ncbi:unnamed protein product [Sympodiomycopsis kandeliae]